MYARFRGCARGASLVEFALALPLLFMLVFCIVDFGLYFFVEHTIQFATREGVRLALVGGTLADANGNPLGREASIIQRVRERARIAIDPSRLQINIYPVAADFSDPVNWQNTVDAGQPGSYMRVRTTYAYTFITPVLYALVTNGRLDASAQATYRNELF